MAFRSCALWCLAVLTLFLVLAPRDVSAQQLTCPTASARTWGPIQLAPQGAWETPAGELDVQPCEVLTVSVSARALNCCGSMSVLVRNAANQEIFYNNFGTDSTGTSFQLPLPDQPLGDPFGSPYPATRTSSGLPRKIRFTTLYAAEFTISVSRTPRAGYNTGSDALSGATAVTTNTVLRGTLWSQEPQYYRLSVPPGGSISAAGQATAGPTIAPSLSIRILSTTGAFLGYLTDTGQFVNTISIPTPSSAPWVNTSSATQDVIVAFQSSAYVRDYQVSINCGCQQRTLTLFLDRDGTFNPQAPSATDQWSGFVPGATAAGGSVQLNTPNPIQRVRVIAAYVDSFGLVVAPADALTPVTFQLSDTSAFEGMAMNVADPRGNASADYTLEAPSASFAADFTARAWLDVWDYGGFTKIAAVQGASSVAPRRLPADDNGNWLPDGGWSVDGVRFLDTGLGTDDTDSLGSQATTTGDGLTAFEEFRGFIVSGVHVRTSPAIGDLFVYSQLPEGLGDASALPFRVRRVIASEILLNGTPLERSINFNFANSGYNYGISGGIPGHYYNAWRNTSGSVVPNQFALRIVDGGQAPIRADGSYDFGSTSAIRPATPPANPYSPANVNAIPVFTQSIKRASPTRNNTTTPDMPDQSKTNQTIAHEVGHALGLDHISAKTLWPPSGCPAQIFTVMLTDYFVQTKNAASCPWVNIPHVYAASDLQRPQLK